MVNKFIYYDTNTQFSLFLSTKISKRLYIYFLPRFLLTYIDYKIFYHNFSKPTSTTNLTYYKYWLTRNPFTINSIETKTPQKSQQRNDSKNMVNNMQMTFLKDFKSHKTVWRIQVKVLHSWRQLNKIAGDSLEFILLDANVSVLFFIDLCLRIFVFINILFNLT